MRNLAIIVLVSSAVLGCSTLKHPGAPAQSYDETADIKALEQRYGQATALSNFFDGPQTVDRRNELISGRLTLINLEYISFIRDNSATQAQLDTALDLLITGVGIATTAVGGAEAKTILGGVSTGLGAARTSIDKNFFYEQTMPALITAMNAQRRVALLPIIEGSQQDLAHYSMPMALSDLAEYYFAGTFSGGLQAIQKDAGQKEAAADKRIEIARSPEGAAFIASKQGRDAVAELLVKIKTLPDAQAISIAKSPPVKNESLDKSIEVNGKRPWLEAGAAARNYLYFRVSMAKDQNEVAQWKAALLPE